jgi:hypothetical protein
MDDILKGESGAAFVLFFLFPGFLGSFIYDFLVEGRKRENFERIIAALMLTLLSSIIMKVAFAIPLAPPHVGKDAALADVIDAFVGRNLLYASLMTIVISVIFAYLNNSGALYWVLGQIGITYAISDRDVWSDTLKRYRGGWIHIRFDDGRSIIGWPRFYFKPGEPREIFVADATWLLPGNSGDITRTDVAGPGVYIPDFAAVTSIELLK